jgi:hypothetical protein
VTVPSDAWAGEIARLRAGIAAGRVTRDAAAEELMIFTAANGIAITRQAAETLISGES